MTYQKKELWKQKQNAHIVGKNLSLQTQDKNIVRNHPTHLTKPIIEFITLDKHLETFLKEYHVNYSSLIESVTLININISLDLFPILNDKKLTINKKLKNTIEKKLQKIFISQTPP